MVSVAARNSAKNLNYSFCFSVKLSGQPCLPSFAFPLLPDHMQLYPQTCVLRAAKMQGKVRGKGLRLGESDGCKILP